MANEIILDLRRSARQVHRVRAGRHRYDEGCPGRGMTRDKLKRQLKAVTATKHFVEKEARKGRDLHNWDVVICPLCREFNPNLFRFTCEGCPCAVFTTGVNFGCAAFIKSNICPDESARAADVPIEYILSLLIDLEDCYKRMVRK